MRHLAIVDPTFPFDSFQSFSKTPKATWLTTHSFLSLKTRIQFKHLISGFLLLLKMVRTPTPICPISVPENMKDQSAIYPRVKVREEKHFDDHPAVCEQKRSYFLSLKDLESLVLQDSSNSSVFTGKEHCVSPSSTAKIPKAYSSNVIRPSTSESQETRSKKDDEDNKVNVRASSIPMPRAVVSSHENDLMIGKKNRKTTETPSVLKNHKSVQSRHSQCKTVASHSGNENPSCSTKSKDTADNKRRTVRKNGVTNTGGSFMSKKTPQKQDSLR